MQKSTQVSRQYLLEKAFPNNHSLSFFKRKPPLFSLLYHLAILLDSHLPLLSALSCLIQSEKNKQSQLVLKNLHKNLLSGQKFSTAIQEEKIDPFTLSLIQIGEEQDQLVSALFVAVHYAEKTKKLKENILKKLSYPFFLIFLVIAIFAYLIYFFLPGIENFIHEIHPGKNRDSSWIFLFFPKAQRYFPLACLVGLVACIFLFKKAMKGDWAFPGAKSLMLYFLEYRFASLLIVILKTSLPITQGLALLTQKNEMQNQALQKQFRIVNHELIQGNSLFHACEKWGKLSEEFLALIRVGEESQNLLTILEKWSTYAEGRFDRRLERYLNCLESISLFAIATLILLILLSIYSPLFSVMAEI